MRRLMLATLIAGAMALPALAADPAALRLAPPSAPPSTVSTSSFESLPPTNATTASSTSTNQTTANTTVRNASASTDTIAPNDLDCDDLTPSGAATHGHAAAATAQNAKACNKNVGATAREVARGDSGKAKKPMQTASRTSTQQRADQRARSREPNKDLDKNPPKDLDRSGKDDRNEDY